MTWLILAYLFGLVTAGAYLLANMAIGNIPQEYEPIRVAFACCITACLGGCLYCIRAVYINKSAKQRWNPVWHIWYFLRPLASFICGGASFLFLKAGLLILESSTKSNASEVGFYALAFVAGLNVDKFVAKIEDVAHAVWGIERSRSNKNSEEKNAQSTHS